MTVVNFAFIYRNCRLLPNHQSLFSQFKFSLQVYNYLPSISAAISLTPQRYIWRFCVGLHSAPRFLIAASYFNFYRRRFARQNLEQLGSVLTLLFAVIENAGLLLLTYVCSTETYCECGLVTCSSHSPAAQNKILTHATVFLTIVQGELMKAETRHIQ